MKEARSQCAGPAASHTAPQDGNAARWLDVLAAAAGLALLSPLFAVMAVAIKLSDGGPVLYRQWRIGRGFQPFQVYKFRTMVPGAEQMGAAITAARDPRATRLGNFLRRYKLDELPQLLNVLRGEMALVGPRPEVPEYVERFRDEYGRLLRARPGLTDPATLAYADEAAILSGADYERTYAAVILPRKLALSLRYLERRTWRSDLTIVWRTLGCVLSPGPAKITSPPLAEGARQTLRRLP